MTITHQDIAARFAAIREEQRKSAARDHRERLSLQELCGGLGHTFGAAGETLTMNFETSERRHGLTRECTVCGWSAWLEKFRASAGLIR